MNINWSTLGWAAYILWLPPAMFWWFVSTLGAIFGFLWSLEGSLDEYGRTHYTLSVWSWLWLALSIFIFLLVGKAARIGRVQQAQRAEYWKARFPSVGRALRGNEPLPVQQVENPVQHVPEPFTRPEPTPPAPAAHEPVEPGPELTIVSYGSRVRRGGHSSSGVPIRDRRTVNPDNL